MRLATEVRTLYRCLDCGYGFTEWPDDVCCDDVQESPNTERLLTPAEVAELAQVSRGTVNVWVNSGKLPALREGKVVRVRRADWVEFVAGR